MLAMAAALALVVWTVVGQPPSDWDGVKGVESIAAAGLELRVVAGHTGAEGFVLDGRVLDGQQVPRAATLLFELETDRESVRYLWAVDADERVTWLAPSTGAVPRVHAAGRARVLDGDDWSALDLVDMVPPIRLIAALSAEPVPPADVLAAWRSGGADTLRFTQITVRVAP